MSIKAKWMLVGSLVLLAGCQGTSTTFEVQEVERTLQEPECQAERGCAEISLKYIDFPQAPELSEELQVRLFSMLAGIGEEPVESDAAVALDAQAADFFANAREARSEFPEIPAYNASLEAEVVADHDDLLVVELSGYIYTGGAHGLPLTEYMVIDKRSQRRVGLADILLEGQRQAFDEAQARAHLRWLEESGLGKEYAAQWPLEPSDNAAPMKEDMVVKYNAYAIAPYAAGQPELHIPYAELKGIIAPRYLPEP